MPQKISKEIITDLMAWFEIHHRAMPWRGSNNPYHIWVSEMMLQQTQVITVEKYYSRWIERFPDVFTLANATLEDVLKIWEGLGYYTRARNFHKGAKYIVEHANSREKPFPETYAEWLNVPGVGPYTAAAVSSIAFGFPAGVVDANVLRVMARFFCIEKNVSSAAVRRDMFEYIGEHFYEYHPGWVNQAWMELGSLCCTPEPDCTHCPIASACCAYKKNKVRDYPLKSPKKKIPVRHAAAFIVRRNDSFLMVRRQEKGFLGGLWEFPGYTEKGEEPDPQYREEFLSKNKLLAETSGTYFIRHTYSHFHQDTEIFMAKLQGDPEPGYWTEARWVSMEELGRLPRSGQTLRILKKLENGLSAAGNN
jgi:A/G-specific adenine glycosylase